MFQKNISGMENKEEYFKHKTVVLGPNTLEAQFNLKLPTTTFNLIGQGHNRTPSHF
jgi:hypothetical protein